MPISILCQHCGQSYNVKDGLRGKRLKCKCGQAVVVPGGVAASKTRRVRKASLKDKYQTSKDRHKAKEVDNDSHGKIVPLLQVIGGAILTIGFAIAICFVPKTVRRVTGFRRRYRGNWLLRGCIAAIVLGVVSMGSGIIRLINPKAD